MEGVQMTNNTKQSEETFIQWRIAGNPVVSGESASEAILTIHPDGRVTTSDRLKPTEAAALVLDQLKTAWLKDAQATKIRELQDRIKRLEEFVEQLTNPKFTRDDLPKEALLQRIKRLEEAGDRMRLYCADPDDCFAWDRAKETKP
jgi:hypothetical protein